MSDEGVECTCIKCGAEDFCFPEHVETHICMSCYADKHFNEQPPEKP